MPRLPRIFIFAATLCVAAAVNVDAQFHEKKEARIAASEKPQNVKGGMLFQVAVPYEKAYASALNHLKREGIRSIPRAVRLVRS